MGAIRGIRPVIGVSTALVLAISIAGPTLAVNPSPNGSSESAEPTVPPGPPVALNPKDSATELPPIEAVGWMIADATTGEIMASRGAQITHPPASTLKVLTAYSLLPNLQEKSVYTATKKDEEAEGSHAGIEAGGKYRVIDIANGLLLPSGNDAASALAHAYGGWGPALKHMNSEARRLGARHTHAVNPSGLDADGQVTTPQDMVTIFRAALTIPLFRKTIHQTQASFPGGPVPKGTERETYTITGQDHLLQSRYQGLIGGKSGYTTNAGRTFVGAATRGGHTLIYSLMRTEIATEDAARKMLDWGFDNIGKVHPVGMLPNPAPTLGPPVPAPAAKYSIDGKLLSAPGQTAGAAVANQAKAPKKRPPAKNIAATDNASIVTLPWLPQALAAFVFVLILLVAGRAVMTFRRHKSS